MKKKTDKSFLILSTIIGVIFAVVAEMLYDDIFKFNSRILCITIYLLVFAVIFSVILLFKGLRNSTYVNFGKVMLLTLVATIALGGCSALFEFLYELGGTKNTNQPPELQYVFLIDDSGSMASNDEFNERYYAVETIVNQLNATQNFAVYTFENETHCKTAMGSTASVGYRLGKPTSVSNGGTYMITAADEIIDDVCNNKNAHTKIIVLTDGVPSDNAFGSYNRLVRKCVRKGASISSIGFGSPDENFLKNLADNTGGVYVFSDNIDSLTTNLQTIVNTQTLSLDKNRDLLGNRFDSTYDSFGYAALRVLFLILLGGLWSIIKLLLVGEKRFSQSSAVLSGVLCSLAAILCEVLLLIGISDFIVRIIFCALWACTLIQVPVYEKVNLENLLHSGRNNVNTGNLANDFSTKSQEVGGPKSFL